MLRIKLKYLIILPDYNQIFTPEISIEVPYIKFHVNSDIGSRDDACGQTEGQTIGYDEGHRRSFRLYECAYKEVTINIRTYESGWFPLTAWVSNLPVQRATTAVVVLFKDRTWRNDSSFIPSRSHKCVIFIVQAQSTNVASGCMIEPGGTRV